MKRVFKNLFGDGSKIHADEIAHKDSIGSVDTLGAILGATLVHRGSAALYASHMDDLTDIGSYFFITDGISGLPLSMAGTAIVLGSRDRRIQIVYRNTSSHSAQKLYFRLMSSSASEFGPWKEVQTVDV